MNRILGLIVGVLLSASSFADWELDASQSSFSFGTTKNDTIGENHKFHKLSGFVQNNGVSQFEIDLLSVDTGIEIRDERMQKMLFTSAQKAIYKTEIDMAALQSMASGQQQPLILMGQLQLNGKSIQLPIKTTVSKMKSGSFMVETTEPHKMDVGLFGFNGGVESLRAIANLKMISPVITFEFNIVFKSIGIY